MSLVNLLKKKSKIELFTTPSHGQRFFIFNKFRQFYKYDISETDSHNPQEALLSAQKNAAKLYGTKSTHFLTNGSTSGVIAAVLSCAGKDEKVLIWEKAHPSHLNAVELSGAIPVFYGIEKDQKWGIPASTCPQIIEENLKKEKIKTVIITSPTYEGVVSDIKKIKEICEKYHAYLIVDEAHGALYPFCEDLPTSAITYADFIIQSLHKTAGGLNPTALLHCNIEGAAVDKALSKITTTSPSYPLLATIEKNINFLNSKKARRMIADLIENIQTMKKNLPNCEFFPNDDATKIVVKMPKLTGFEFSEKLFEMGIEDELSNAKSVMLLCGIGTDLKKLKKLERVLKKFSS